MQQGWNDPLELPRQDRLRRRHMTSLQDRLQAPASLFDDVNLLGGVRGRLQTREQRRCLAVS